MSDHVASVSDWLVALRAAAAEQGIDDIRHPDRRRLVPPLLNAYVAAMRPIPGGTFTMGDDRSLHSGEKPAHPVTLSAFRMGATPATVGMWREYCATQGLAMPEAPEWGWIDDHPMVHVSWEDIMGADGKGGFCAWASGVAGVRLTLPTEAQWEYCARDGGKPIEYPWGNDFDADKCRCSEKDWGDAGSTAAVSRPDRIHRNGLGLTDLAGNVREWCADRFGAYPRETKVVTRMVTRTESAGGIAGWFGATREVRGAENETVIVPPSQVVRDPSGPATGDARVLRGGSWVINYVINFRCAYRYGYSPDVWNYDLGFRLSIPGP